MPYVFPTVKGTQNATDFYLTTLDYGEISTLVVLPEDFLGTQLLDDDQTMQRKLSWTRVKKEMKEYLLQNPDAFYSALTLFMVPRDLKPLREGEGYEFRPIDDRGNYGTLELRSMAVLFPGDGQHRAASIKEALREDPSLAEVQIPVVLIPFTSRGKVRQLFSDLNLNAKPVNRTIGLSFETRDPLAIITKRVAEEVPLFRDRVNRRSNSLAASSENVITMNALYTSNDLLLDAFMGADKDDELSVLRSRPFDDPEIGEAAAPLVELWDVAINALPEWERVLRGATSPGDVRNEYVFAHALGWQAIAHAAAVIIKSDRENWEEILSEALSAVDWSRANPDWHGVAMAGMRVNNTSTGIRATAGYILQQVGVLSRYAEPYIQTLELSRAQVAVER
jgi:DNA sulfur modification protein DndB